MKKIWIFNHYIVPPSIEIGHRHNKFAKYLVKDGYEVSLFFSSALHSKNYNLINNKDKYLVEETKQGRYIAVKTRDYNGNGKKRILNMIDYFLGLISVTKKIKKKHGSPDIIYASSVHPLTCVAGLLLAKRYKVKCIVEIRDLWPLTLVEFGMLSEKSIISQLMYKLEHWIYKRADAIIFTGEGEKQYIVDKGWSNDVDLSKIYYINNGIDLEVFNHQKQSIIYSDNDLDNTETFKIIYTGSLGQANAVNYIVEAAKIISDKKYKDIKFIIFGDGSEREKLIEYCMSNHLNNVIFKGTVDKKYIPSILSRGNLLVFSSKNINYKYGLSLNKMFDYFASQKPVLSNITTTNDLLKKYGCGITVKPSSAISFAEGVINFYNMPSEDYIQYCKNSEKAADEYDFRELTNKLEKIICNTIKGKHS